MVRSAFFSWINYITLLKPLMGNTKGKWVKVDFDISGYMTKNPSYRSYQLLWTISSRINNESSGCQVTVESRIHSQKCSKMRCDQLASDYFSLQIENYRNLPIMACCLENIGLVMEGRLEVREYRIIFRESGPYSGHTKRTYLHEIIGNLSKNTSVCTYNAYWVS
ncbi:hypothetical protein EG68_02575 [Paragonimus skrjabini miyazakii]|uniref:Uncharacterized protein n=1 Tax=Paragonimus skrjabini miyazakii TaxID=59628 RepID=A0A8S9Z4W9_9TREM|nr:hypothetical protein EG68_02575 [Paragonimus skrjabini miyazakii]